MRIYSLLGCANEYGERSYKESKSKFLGGDMLVERNHGQPKFIDPKNVQQILKSILVAMSDAFLTATTTNARFDDSVFATVHGQVKSAMLEITRHLFGNAPFNYQLSDEGQLLFEVEASLFLGKFAWMVLQHILSFPRMLEWNAYEQHAHLFGRKQKNENNDNEDKDWQLKPTNQGRDIFIRTTLCPDYDPEVAIWERVEGIAPTHSPKICVGDIVRVKWKGYHHKEHTTSVVKIVDFKLGSYLDHQPLKFEVIQQVRIVDIKLEKN